MPQPPPAEERQVRPFAAVLQEQRNGAAHQELSEALADVSASVTEHGKTGTVTLTITVTRNKDGRSLTVFDEIKTKMPKADRGASVFYADDDGNLSRRDPRQPELPLRDASAPPISAQEAS